VIGLRNLLFISLLLCQNVAYSATASENSDFSSLVKEAKTRIKETTVQEVYKRLRRGDKFHLIDVREDREWNRGYIKGAKHISKGVIERDIAAIISKKDDELILYCSRGNRSALVADALKKMGYKNVKSMAGGYTSWVKAGFNSETN